MSINTYQKLLTIGPPMLISKRLLSMLLGLAFACGMIIFSMVGLALSGGTEAATHSTFPRLFVLLGGNFLGGGYIQLLTYFAFAWSLVEIIDRLKLIKNEKLAYRGKLLPTKEKVLLLASDVMEIQLKAIDYEKKNSHSLLASIIKKACLKFRSTKSIGEMIEIISIQTDINKEKHESDQSNIRYLTWVIPSIGFIGTVLGISKALMVANSGDMDVITATLGVAFDTTLISLILSIIVMWFFHSLQEETDQLHAEMKEFVIENLVNRIEV
jgi:biopolymer transport protein ExbB/TolQ